MLRTMLRVLAGFALACLTAGLVQVLFVETPKEMAAVPVSQVMEKALNTLVLTLLAATHFAVFSAAFALIAAGIAEWLSLRSPAYWLAAGTGIAFLGFIAQYASEVAGQPSIFNNYALQAYLTAGFFGGLVYWLVAGARSGATVGETVVVAADASPAPAAAPAPRIIVEKSTRGSVRMGSLAEKLSLKRRAELDPSDAPEASDAVRATDGAVSSAPLPAQDTPPATASQVPPVPAKTTTSVPVTKSGK